jgi:hypothetical protein
MKEGARNGHVSRKALVVQSRLVMPKAPECASTSVFFRQLADFRATDEGMAWAAACERSQTALFFRFPGSPTQARERRSVQVCEPAAGLEVMRPLSRMRPIVGERADMRYAMKQKLFCWGDDYRILDQDGRDVSRNTKTV